MLRVIQGDKNDEWDEIVKSFPDHDVYYLNGYLHGFSLHGDGHPLLFYFEGSKIRAMNAVMRRDISDDPQFSSKLKPGKLFDIITPYGYGGWLIDGDGLTEDLDKEYSFWCADHHIISEFVRFHPVLENAAKMNRMYHVVNLGETISMDLESPEIIWSNLKSKNRNMIRKARKFGVSIHHGNTREQYETFRRIYNETMERDEAKLYYFFEPAFYESIRNDLADNAEVFYAMLEDKIIAASIMLYCGKRLNYHLSGTCTKFRSMAPSNLLLYEAALWGCEHGYKTLHLGGGVGSSEDGLLRFKKSFFRGKPKQYSVGCKVFLREQYDELIRMRSNEDNWEVDASFFPQYRS